MLRTCSVELHYCILLFIWYFAVYVGANDQDCKHIFTELHICYTTSLKTAPSSRTSARTNGLVISCSGFRPA